jgi:5-methylcytosine-specific restriction protein A
MPYLKKPKTQRVKQIRTDTYTKRRKVYQTERWKRLRLGKLHSQPTCEICDARGIISLAVDVHHADSVTNYDGEMLLYKAYDPDNLVSLCKECHSWLHRGCTTRGIDIKQVAEELDKEFGPGIKPFRQHGKV